MRELSDLPTQRVTAYVYVDINNVSVQWEGVAQNSGRSPEVLLQGLDSYVAEAFPGFIFINTGSVSWRELQAIDQTRLAAHEYFHTIQMGLMGPSLARAFYASPVNQIGPAGPNWLVEGSAEYFSWRTLQHAGLLDLDGHMSSKQLAPSSPRSIATYAGFYLLGQYSYDVSLDAVYALVGQKNTGALVNYFRLIGLGFKWQEAFTTAFGIELEDFYTAYEFRLLGPR